MILSYSKYGNTSYGHIFNYSGVKKCGSKGMCVSVIGDSCKTDVDCNADGRFIVNRCNQTTSTCESYFRPGASCKKSSECGGLLLYSKLISC